MRENRSLRWWRSPRHTFLRRALFQVHLWSGLLLCLYVLVISLSGSILVFKDEIEHAADPALFDLADTGSYAPLDQILADVRQAYPRFQALGIDRLNDPKHSAVIYLQPRNGRSIEQWMVYVDRHRGKILGAQSRYGGFLGFCANLHYYLLAGERGYTANGVLAIAFLLICATGWLLWWPGARRVAAGLRIHWRARLKRLNWDLHTVGGFWSNPLLIAVVITGVYFVFPQPILRSLTWLSGEGTKAVEAYLATPESKHSTVPRIPAQLALERAEKALPAGEQLRYLSFPENGAAVFEGIADTVGAPPYAKPVRVFIDQFSGAVLGMVDGRHLPWGLRASTYVYAVHFGSFAGLISKTVWFLLGVVSSVLVVSGLIMYWNRFLGPRWKALRAQPEQATFDEELTGARHR